MIHLALMSLSLRKDSFNKKLLKIAEKWLTDQGVSLEIINLLDYPLPAYNGDVEQDPGIPELAKQLKARIEKPSGFIIASPEYNFSMPGHFKNTFDWLSRYEPKPFSKKTMLLLSASMSLVGGNRGLWSLRVPFEYVGTYVYPDMFSLATAHQAFDEKGALKSVDMHQRLIELLANYVNYCRKLQG
jgi:chromate reductase